MRSLYDLYRQDGPGATPHESSYRKVPSGRSIADSGCNLNQASK